MRTGWRDAGHEGPHPKIKPGTGPLAAVPPGGRGPLPRSDAEAVSCEDCYAGPQDSAGAPRPSTRKGAPDGTHDFWGGQWGVLAGSAGAMHLLWRADRLTGGAI